jgi:hypothetical protein
MPLHSSNTFGTEGGGSACARTARQYAQGETDEFPMSGNVGLNQCLRFAGISKSTAYAYGLVPIYDEGGIRIDPGKAAPFPWLPMPDSIVRGPGQKKIFLAEEIRAWRDAVVNRSRRLDSPTLNSPNALYKRGENQHV